MADASTLAPILHDQPADQDALDFQPYVDALADILLDPATQTPVDPGHLRQLGQRQDQPDADDAGEGSRRGQARRRCIAPSGLTPGSTTMRTRCGARCSCCCWTNWKPLLPDRGCWSRRNTGGQASRARRSCSTGCYEALYREMSWTERGDKVQINWTEAAAGAGGWLPACCSVVRGGLRRKRLRAKRLRTRPRRAGQGGAGLRPGQADRRLPAERRRSTTRRNCARWSSSSANFAQLVKALLPPPRDGRGGW